MRWTDASYRQPGQHEAHGARAEPGDATCALEGHWWARRPEWAVLGIVVLFGGIAWFSVQHINPLWDETNDHSVAVSLMDRPLVGSGLDGSQARLPMYVTAAAYAVAGPSIRTARAVSIAMGAAAIVLTFIAGRRWCGTATGLLAAGLLSISPFFLTFARTGLTEGDAFCPASILLMLLAFDRYLQRRDSVRLVLFAAALALAMATKFYAVLFLPPLLLSDVVDLRRRASERKDTSIRIVDSNRLAGRDMRWWAIAAVAAQLLAAVMAQLEASRWAVVFWAAGIAVLAAGPVDQFVLAPAKRRTARRLMRWTTQSGWLVVLPLAAAVCGAVCPAHVLNPEILRALLRSIAAPIEPEAMMRVVDPARLHLGVILIKLGLPLGAISLVAIFWASLQQTSPRLSPAGASVILYGLALLALPLRQSFYLMSVYPLIILLLSAFVMRTAIRLRNHERAVSAWIAIVATACLYLLTGTIRSYPEFGYYGYAQVGNTWLGAESRGYRNLIQVTNDGTQDALEWMAAHVPPGRRVVSFLWDDHVIDACLQNAPPLYHLVRRNAYEARYNPPEIEDADFVAVALNNYLSYDDVPSRIQLEAQFNPVPVHVVRRGRGEYQMSVVQIFGRSAPTSRPASDGGT